jgi:hypothetical protein
VLFRRFFEDIALFLELTFLNGYWLTLGSAAIASELALTPEALSQSFSRLQTER